MCSEDERNENYLSTSYTCSDDNNIAVSIRKNTGKNKIKTSTNLEYIDRITEFHKI